MSLAIPEGTYLIDPTHSYVGFSVAHLGISLVRGSFSAVEGALAVGTDLASTSVGLEIGIASINTGNDARDGHLLGSDFFDVDNHGSMTFASSQIDEAGSGHSLTGWLTIKGHREAVSLHVKYGGQAPFAMDGSTRYGFAASGTIQRSAFGLDYGAAMIADQVDLTIHAQFVNPSDT